ncbi:MAG: adenylyl-sulfate kinase [Planctomycetes bacterium]|nr:adenylyl-sulfate kinase [Planctomycetota bacterium]
MSIDQSLSNQERQPGLVVWLTGLSGSGKTTIAIEAEKRLFARQVPVYRLDGDILRQGLNADLGFSPAGRKENIRRAAEVARLFQDAGLILLASFISPQRSMRAFARSLVPEGAFIEVYVQASLETCIQRDPKGNYQRALAGKIQNYTGIDQEYEEPLNPELVLNTDQLPISACAARVVDEIDKRITVLQQRKRG